VIDPWWYVPHHARVRYDIECGSIPNALRQTARRMPQAEALVGEDGRRTFAELDEDMHAAVRAVLALGVRPGDRVGLWGPNSGRWLVAALGILGAGAVLVPLNTRFKGEEAAYVLRKSGAGLLFATSDFLEVDYVGMLRAADPDLDVLRPGRTVLLSGPSCAGGLDWREFLAAGSAVPNPDAVAAIDAVGPDSLSDIMFTSGTTGHPKGVQLTHGQSLRAHGFYAKLMGFRAGDRYLIIPPFFHTFGYKAGWMACLVHGATILPQRTFDVDDVLDTMERERVSILFGPPTVFQGLLDSPRRGSADLSALRLTMAASTAVPPELLERIRDELRPESMWAGYGLTEATSLVTTTVADDDFEHLATTAGRPAWDVEVRILDAGGAELGPGEPGEIAVRGFNVMTGYWDEPERTAEAIDADGWLHTGDIGTLDEQGYLRITDRKKDMILVGGFNVYPAEVERILGRYDGLESIAIVSAPDERLGEVPVAFLVSAPGASIDETAFLAWARDRIANFKCPRRAHVVAQLPRNASMKVLKNELRALARELS
jgi:acyl-CoA synthetase (AMP-forming)/AMP-acid ligase II